MNLIQKLLIAILITFYFFLVFLVLNPNVSAAYKAYYITHEAETWILPDTPGQAQGR